MIRVERGDCLEVVPQLVAEGVQVDAVVTDPPYHLSDMAARAAYSFAKHNNQEDPKANKDGRTGFARLAGGFMGKKWDGGDITFRPETWATIATALKPGGYLLAFGGTRTHHRIWCAIEDAGFVIQDTIIWLHGQGFPKGREQLKPAFEPICVAYKPGGKRELQIDGCRIPGSKRLMIAIDSDRRNNLILGTRRATFSGEISTEGRWPANVCHDGGDEVMEAFAKFETHGAGFARSGKFGDVAGSLFGLGKNGAREMRRVGDTGSAARFFYSSKAGPEDRWGSKHPTVKPVELIKWLVSLVTPLGGTFLDCFAGSGTAGVAALATGRNAILIEREAEYIADIRERLAFYEGKGRHSLASKARFHQETSGTLL